MGRFSARGLRQSGRWDRDSALFDVWVEKHATELYRFAHRLCGDIAAAEDLVQETFYEAWKHRGPLRSIREPRAWLFLILRRRYGKLRRLEQRRPWIVSLGAIQAETEAPPPRSDRIEAADSLQSALDDMSDLFKLPLLMVFVQGMTCAQAAEQLDVPLGTVLSRIHRAKKQMREALRRDEEGEGNRDARESGPGEQPRLRIGGA